MVLRGGVVEVFDCLEFSPSLRWIDVISDLAFLVMDLGQRGRSDLGCQLLDRWLARCGDYPGLRLWRWYVVYRAVVRAKVCALQLRQGEGDGPLQANLRHDLEGYLQLALDLSVHGGPSPCGSTPLLITHGVSGSGKSHLAGALARHCSWIRLRSDVERKRLFGRWGESLDPPRQGDPYSPEVSAWLYGEHLPGCAEAVIRAGFGVIVDATFLDCAQRQLFAQLAERLGVGFAVLDCRVTPELARRRIAQRRLRGLDPSDADAAVLAAQLARNEPLSPAELSRAVVFEPDGEQAMEGLALEGLISGLEPLLKPRVGPKPKGRKP
jgi:predicted kinase